MSSPACNTLLSLFSNALLDIQRLAHDQSVEHFHDAMLARLQGLIAFDKAWWGRAALIDGMLEEHRNHLFHLQADYLQDWRCIREDDITLPVTHSHPGQAVIIDMHSTEGLRWLGARHGIQELLCVMVIDPLTQLSEHLALYRNPGQPRFSDTDRMLLDHVMPHLAAAISANQIRTLIAQRESLDSPHNLALAVCDRKGTLQCAERGFIERWLGCFAQWSGPNLPIAISEGEQTLGALQLTITRAGDLFVLAARPRTPLQCLSPREYDVAQGFGEGKTYKEVARELGLAPNTVRHHIRTIYTKLGVKDKARIAQLLRAMPD
ncbi:helix-turn-helix transcriptional regulator [Pseudomonas vanderleydeniana]|uniref:LuxR C-terminal-related transcriptional regulator n=1 Tax=Pseudomonas vanderleydeniana TaxID=2745495 RepID=A0A9E6PHJ4_9PSED|nr:LuxR family transcriptional regulator [Pseudomonas vanderleydeniana]QXI26213.1 LuxR C-terminal-related transcriptional regulator [Pseudomonas vanderleydeniana]